MKAVVVAAVAAAAIYYLESRKPATPKTRAANITELIGNTPVVRLNHLSKLTGCDIFVKLEMTNPGGSAKDRVALAIVEDCEAKGLLRRGRSDVVFEGTSGSTGISLALVCRSRGYEAHIVVPDDTSSDKVALLTAYGAHVHKVRPASIADRGHYVNVARQLADKVNADHDDSRQAVFANQFENKANWQVHYRTTGPEILQQVPNVTCFVSGAGTGGTIAGVAKYLESAKIVLADVPGSGLYNKVHFGVMFNDKEREGTRRRHQVDTLVEGIGINRVTANLRVALDAHIDDSVRVSDADARYMADLLVKTEGLFAGSSSAVNCVAAFRQARKQNGQVIVTVLCDSGTRHMSKFYALKVEDCDLKREICELEINSE